MAIREGLWDCQYCGAQGIPGREKVCPNCARSRPEGTKFYLPEDRAAAPVITDEKLIQQAKAGADWICEYCSSSNPAELTVCRHCGAAREASSPQQEVVNYALEAAPTSGDMDLDAPAPAPAPAPARSSGRKGPAWLPIAVVGVVVLLLVLCGFFVFRTTEQEVTVAGFQWERTIEIEALETVVEEDWSVPAGGRLISQREEIRTYSQVLDHYETRQRQVAEQVQAGQRTYVCGQRDLGNGFFEDIECSEPIYETRYRTETYQEPVYIQVPVFDTLYRYEIEKWVPVRTERASGSNHDPTWPAVSLAENEREAGREESYSVTFASEDGEQYEMELPLESWLALETNGRYELELNAFGQPEQLLP